MNKRYLHHLWTAIRPIKTYYFIAALLVCGLVHAAALRANNVRMAELRNAVYAADEKNGDVEQALLDLRAFVSSHMNTKLDNGKGVYPPIQLKYTYERLVKAEQDRINAANAAIYTEAQKHCEKLDPYSALGRERVPCIQEYIKSHGTQTAKTIPDALYKFDFVSARWSPDLAGWTLVLSIILTVLTLARFGLGRILQTLTK